MSTERRRARWASAGGSAAAAGSKAADRRAGGPARARRRDHARRALGRRRQPRRPGETGLGRQRSRSGRRLPRATCRVPEEIRGVHVTMGLASLPGKLQQYLAMPGLNTLELDVKDENGHVGFVPPAVPLARRDRRGAARTTTPTRVAQAAHARGIYLIGRVVIFEDPMLSAEAAGAGDPHERRLASGSTTRGLGWTNPYDRRVWKYDVDLGVAAAKAGLRRDPVRLRALPERRRPLADPSIPAQAAEPMVVDDRRASSSTRRGGCTRSACASRSTSSGSRPRTTSASASCRGGSRGTSTPSTRWSTRRTTTRRVRPRPTRTPPRARRSRTRCSTSRRALEAARRELDPVAPGLLARPHVHARRTSARRSQAARAPARRRLPALEPGGPLRRARAAPPV